MYYKNLAILIIAAWSFLLNAADHDLIPVIQKTENIVEKTYAGEELTQKYYKDKVRKILDSNSGDAEKIKELNAIIDKIQQATPKAVNLVNSPELRNALVIVAGEKGVGSGFITEFNGKKSIITNIHVLMGNKMLKFLDCNNHELDFTTIKFAEDRDIAIIELAEGCKAPALTIETDLSQYPVEDKVIVTGNSQGAGSVTRLEGTLKGMGPTVVEVSAAFVQGNSGSPIIATKNGKIIGVATFAVKANENWVNKGSGFENVRRFGTRLDNLDPESLKVYEANKYNSDLKMFQQIRTANETCLKIFADFERNRGMLTAGNFQNDQEMQKIATRWNEAITNPRFGSSYMNALSDMIRVIEAPAKTCKTHKANYNFIENEIKNQIKLNEIYVKHLKGFKTTLDEYRKRQTRQARGL